MGTSEFDPLELGRRAWNAGRKVGAKRALKPRQVWVDSGRVPSLIVRWPLKGPDRPSHLDRCEQYA